ncbi:MAG: RNA-binding S4 domain-containing protein [Bacteroidetes bacterium]|nr:RNA-binding S4 domain-containing protein [Bacteroidota bacterium]MBK8145914.1 RNA-binding S4 domain-containing protein [Bacteroidota bacterium]MBP6314734.1 RNA-binding S4 domain-containing protein [Chitinophagaceae bacterium]
MAEKIRIDKYLWAIRIFKTRSLAAAACDNGKVKNKGLSIKASKAVQLNEEYEIKNENKKILLKVIGIIDKRVSYEEAIKNYIDITPESDIIVNKALASSFYTGKRLSKVGRPTKQNRRKLDDFLGDESESKP